MDEKKLATEADSAAMQQIYPSPIVDSTDAQYYEQLTQDRGMEPQLNHQPAHPNHHGLPNLPEHQDHQDHQDHQEQHEHHELHQLQGFQDSPAPHQQNGRPPVSADDLQLAAQLTQGLAPMMGVAVQDQAQEQQQQPMPQQDGQEGQMQPQAEPNLQEQLEASLQNHEREMQSHGQELQNHELQNVMPHDGQPQPHHYSPENQPPPSHLPHHMSMEHHLPQVHPQYQIPDATPPRKRSKVSRACDECRRKKIKCDAQSEADDQRCSNCRRSNAECLFSRVPQKRGPSKGYIKELADRIGTLEGHIKITEVLDRRSSSEAFASSGLGDESRKRPFSSISKDGFPTPSPNRIMSTHTPDNRPILPYAQPDYRPPNPAEPRDLAPDPGAPMQYPEMQSGFGSQGDAPDAPAPQADQLPEIHDVAFNRYLETVHPTFPVLASSSARVHSLLRQSPLGLQKAFYHGFSAMVRPFIADAGDLADADAATTVQSLNAWEAEYRPRSFTTDLIRLQTLAMALISVDCHGISSARGELGIVSKFELLSRALGIGRMMRLNCRVVNADDVDPETDPNSDDNVALRAWSVLIMLDRWTAIGEGIAPLTSESSTPQPGLKHIAGDVVFAHSWVAFVLGHFVNFTANLEIDPLTAGGAAAGRTLKGMTQVLAGYFPADGITDPVLHLAYWHLRLLASLMSPDFLERPFAIFHATKQMISLLASNGDLLSPLTHHFLAATTLGLVELHQLEDMRDLAAQLTRDVLDYRMPPSPWREAVRATLAACQVRPETAGSPARPDGQNLEQLADLAAAANISSVPPDPPAAADAAIAGDGQSTNDAHQLAAVAQAAAAADPAAGHEVGDIAVAGASSPAAAAAAVDVLAVLRSGYLNWFEDPADGQVV